eukprot:374354_1
MDTQQIYLKVFERQLMNISFTSGYISALYFYVIDKEQASQCPKYLTPLAMTLPALHQFYVAFCWRTELHLKLLTKLFGSTKLAFNIYRAVFYTFIISRMLTAFLVAKY